MSDQKNLGHNSKKDFLKNPVEHIDITSFDARKIISSMKKMSFVSRETANAANIYNEMLKIKIVQFSLLWLGQHQPQDVWIYIKI